MGELFLDGSWVGAATGGRRTIVCPADGTVVGEVDEADETDTLRAIDAARRAADDARWRDTPPTERAAAVGRVADLLERDTEEIARAEALDTGKRFAEATVDVADVVSVFRYYAGLGESVERPRPVDAGQEGVVSRVDREPIGVCSLITPWNYPLLQASWKVAPCLLAGNTFVLKPSEITPHSTILMIRAIEEAGVPAGVANLVLGTGPGCAGPMSTDPRVDMVSFTGSLEVGKHLMREAADTVKRVALELGGKNPNIVFADAPREAAIDNAMTAVFLHSGQVCSAGARLLVEESCAAEVVDAIVERARHVRMGHPFDEDAQTGSLTSAEHLKKVEDYVAAGLAEGARLRCGGSRPDDPRLASGYYYPPTVLDGCTVDMHVVQEESFGPVLTVETFRTEEEAVSLANATRYGLAGAVWTGDPERAQRVARRLRLGTVWINDYHPYVAPAEWGGHKQSGIGRELGELGLEEYQETKHVWENTAPAPTGWFA
ncbi:aldehyde dehydrogenase family protein [Phycicoccus endophyticus]|uniref:Aldehyde dehydrogenase family protein n=1 Tax=Phycicoccus endophyticus TaxID=1690220 RepID=A0A7G9QYW4_9MICO|nr:aldehyde dehydrogenase family protein [Phycicoccus endophyticus]QNN48539.1 aldehyde dehydrogenase family protein [Phycicoccus endophyticus]GGL31082.1 betaine-aldehyde dehydrogenase [Phycicoccus endophyticus]